MFVAGPPFRLLAFLEEGQVGNRLATWGRLVIGDVFCDYVVCHVSRAGTAVASVLCEQPVAATSRPAARNNSAGSGWLIPIILAFKNPFLCRDFGCGCVEPREILHHAVPGRGRLCAQARCGVRATGVYRDHAAEARSVSIAKRITLV